MQGAKLKWLAIATSLAAASCGGGGGTSSFVPTLAQSSATDASLRGLRNASSGPSNLLRFRPASVCDGLSKCGHSTTWSDKGAFR